MPLTIDVDYRKEKTAMMERKNAWLTYQEKELDELEDFCVAYRDFLDHGKTERECVSEGIRLAEAAGFSPLKEAAVGSLRCGDRVYADCMGKSLLLYTVGRKPLSEGMRILGAHIDSPRLDLKQNPLYESDDLAFFDTHYYGGVKKYQWVTVPLALHGVVCKKDGSKVNVVIGEEDGDPVFGITDLLPHLAREQMEKRASQLVEGEKLDLLVGSQPLDGEKDAVKRRILALLKERYGMEEEDFLSAELEAVPAGKARDFGLDRSMIYSYGQDDRVCGFPSLRAALDVREPEYTTCCILVDKEEIGSVGATGMESRFFENTAADLLEACGLPVQGNLRHMLLRSKMISSDVSVGFDPGYPNVFEKKNSAFLGYGLVVSKYTGSRGKSHANDANAEYIAWLRKVLDDAHVAWQTAEIGKVDAGGGGTISYIASVYGMEVIDCGVAVLGMHAPWEITSKADVYEAYKGFRAFLES